jgi:uncharacterized protein (DUF697 family)
MRFWNLVKEVSTGKILEEAGRPFQIGILGPLAEVAEVRAVLLGDATPGERTAAAGFLLECAAPCDDADLLARLKLCTVVLLTRSAPSGPDLGLSNARPLGEESPIAVVLRHAPTIQVALARHLPGFRGAVSERVIQEVAQVNTEFALLSGLLGVLPWLGWLIPVTAGADIFVLTKNQVMMLFRLAAVYGLKVNDPQRAREILPIIGGAFGWRAIARELAGLIPAGAGLVPRGMIAYTGTYATGQAALLYWRTGRRVSAADRRALLADASDRARSVVREMIARLRREKTE